MKVLAITFGTEGDVRPMAALSAAVIAAGHQAILLGPHDALDAATAFGVPSVGLPGAIRQTLGAAGPTANGALADLIRVTCDNTSAWLRLALEHGADADVVIAAGFGAMAGLSAAERLGIPGVGAGMFPLTSTSEFATPFLPPGVLPRWANRASFGLANAVIWRGLAKATNAARSQFGMSPWRGAPTAHPMLYGFSRHLIAPPRDWPASATICGLWSAPTPAWSPPDDLAAFLADGEPPIYIGFGSMTVGEPRRLLGALTEAIGGRRALFSTGWSGAVAPELPSNVFVLGPTPHDWLFPRMAMAIHHGGSGTAHTAARAGVPSIVMPFAADQPFWADRLRRAGVAPSPIDPRRAAAGAIARAIAFADRPDVRARAAELAEDMSCEDGLGTAVARLEQLAGGSRPARPARRELTHIG